MKTKITELLGIKYPVKKNKRCLHNENKNYRTFRH